MLGVGLFQGEYPFDPLLLLLALVVDAAVGRFGPLAAVLPRPLGAVAAFARGAERRLNRMHRPTVDRAIRGLLVVLLAGGCAAALGWGVAVLARMHPHGAVVELLAVLVVLDVRWPPVRALAVAGALRKGEVDKARALAAPMIRHEPAGLDAHGVARGAAAALAEGHAARLTAAAFWYLLLGVPGLWTYAAVRAVACEVGQPVERLRAFGFAASRLDFALAAIPFRLAALLFGVAALFVPGARAGRALAAAARDGRRHPRFNVGWPVAALAGALGACLGGPEVRGADRVMVPWLGDGSARLRSADLRRAVYIYAVACLLVAAVLTAMVLLRFA